MRRIVIALAPRGESGNCFLRDCLYKATERNDIVTSMATSSHEEAFPAHEM